MSRTEALTLPEERYPSLLADWKAKHRTLWFRGNLELLQKPMVSIVGSRLVSAEGLARTKRSARIAIEGGWGVVSGLAAGVDTAAHQTALECGGDTIAVLGTPIEQCYPKENRALKAEIEDKGLVISQFAPGTSTHRGNFPTRNTLMAALSKLTLVVEAGPKSGTRHQAKDAVKMRRLVGFLRSVSDQNFPWIEETLRSGFGRVVGDEDDLRRMLQEAARTDTAQTPSRTVQGELF